MLLALLLAACQLAATVTVREDGGVPVVSARAPGGGEEPACLQAVTVYPAGVEGAPPIWRVSFDALDGCAREVAYGRTPAGFSQDVAPAPLAAGTRYRVAVIGAGINDGAEFTPSVPVRPPS